MQKTSAAHRCPIKLFRSSPVKPFNEVTEMGIVVPRKKVTERAELFLLVVV